MVNSDKDYILPEDSHSMEMSVMVSTSVMPSKELHLHAADILRDYLVNLGDDESQSVRNGCGSSWGNVGSNPTGGPGEAQYLLCSDDPFLRFYSLPNLFSKNQNAGYAAGYFLCLTTHHRNISTVAPSSILIVHLVNWEFRHYRGDLDNYPGVGPYRLASCWEEQEYRPQSMQPDSIISNHSSWSGPKNNCLAAGWDNERRSPGDRQRKSRVSRSHHSSFSSWGGEILRDMQAPVHQRPVEPCRSGGVNPCSNSTSPHSLSYGDNYGETAQPCKIET